MATAAQIAANRANAQKSTGPRSEDGKARSAMNALKHGLCAEKLLIDEEEREAWEELRADYLARLRPQGGAEARLADRIAQIAWRRERGSTMEAAAWRGYARGGWLVDAKERGKQRWHEDGDAAVAARATPIMNGVTQELLRITMYEGRLTRELARLKAELAELQQARRDRAAADRVETLWAAREAEEREAAEAGDVVPEPEAEPQDCAGIGFVPSPEDPPAAFAPPPGPGAATAEVAARARRERARLDAEAAVFAAPESPGDSTP